MRAIKVQAAAFAAAVTLVAVAGCSVTPTAQPSSDSSEPIVFGYAIAETGGFAGFDAAVVNGARVAAADINAAGGVLGRQIEIKTVDTKSEIDGAAPAAQQLLDDGADFIGSTADYDFGGPALRTADAAGHVSIAMAGDTRLGYNGVGPLAFNSYSGSPGEGVVMAEFAHDQGYRNTFVLTDTINSYPQSVSDAFTGRWAEYTDTTIAGTDLFNNADTSIRTQIDAIKAAAPDSILVASFPSGGAAAIRQIRAAGIDAPILGDIGFDGSYWIDASEGLSDVFVPVLATPESDSEPILAMLDAYEELTGEASIAPSYTAMGYVQVQVIAAAIEAAGSTDGTAVAAALAALDGFESVIGPIDYAWKSECNVPATLPWTIVQVQDGVQSVVEVRSTEEVVEIEC